MIKHRSLKFIPFTGLFKKMFSSMPKVVQLEPFPDHSKLNTYFGYYYTRSNIIYKLMRIKNMQSNTEVMDTMDIMKHTTGELILKLTRILSKILGKEAGMFLATFFLTKEDKNQFLYLYLETLHICMM